LEKIAKALEERQQPMEVTLRSADVAALASAVAATIQPGLSAEALGQLSAVVARLSALEEKQGPDQDLLAEILDALRNLPAPVVQVPTIPVNISLKMPPTTSVFEFVRDNEGRAVRVYKDEQPSEQPQWTVGPSAPDS
jgi:hypothetical protein